MSQNSMTKQEALQIPDLLIEVTPAIEDAFYFLHSMENDKSPKEIEAMTDEEWERYDKSCEASSNAGERLLKVPREERMEAIRQAYKMIDNIKEYGVACADWIVT